MNLLAHALVSPDDPGVLVGNLVADWVKGRARLGMAGDLRAGFMVHRRIDLFTDTHGVVAGCCELFEGRWGRYSGVLVDLFFDHVLSCKWEELCDVPRREFIEGCYAAVRGRMEELPERARYAAHMMMADDWLGCYATLDGMALSLTRISSRLNHGVELGPAVGDFVRVREAMEEGFGVFFPELRRHVLRGLETTEFTESTEGVGMKAFTTRSPA